MCGIAGFYSRSNSELPSSLLESMTSALQHRGPDDQGYFGRDRDGTKQWKRDGELSTALSVGLGFRRLSILDLSPNGAQPMSTPDRRFTLVFNGQIYNYVELREQLREEVRSTGDTEILLRYFARSGTDALPLFNGMFAFAAFDNERRELTLVRDPIGIKPLYWFQDERGFFFASEIRALLVAKKEKPALRRELLGRYLMANWVPDPDTLFDGIYKLEPGHFLRLDKDVRIEKKRYWDFQYEPNEKTLESRWEEETEQALTRAISRQMRSDVPVGFFLSGGVDSSLLAALASRETAHPPRTFTIGYEWSSSKKDSLDIQSARLLHKKFEFRQHEIIVKPSIVDLLPKVVTSLEEPVTDPAALCSYLICEAAAGECKVMISGQGGDELFGGYPVYAYAWAASYLNFVPSLVSMPVPWQRLRKLLVSLHHPWPELLGRLRSAMPGDEARQLLGESAWEAQDVPFGRHFEHAEHARDWDRLHQMMYLDAKTYLPATNLFYSDKTSMAHSVELRVPYLDLEIVRLMQGVPAKYKVGSRGYKPLLKAVAKKVLPVDIVRRKKTGFGIPLADWMREDLQPMARELCARSRDLFHPVLVEKWLDEHRDGKADHAMKLYSLMSFQLWRESFDVTL